MTQVSGKNTLLRYSWSEPLSGSGSVPMQCDVELVTWAMQCEAMPIEYAGMPAAGFKQYVSVPQARVNVAFSLAPPVPPIFAPGKVVPIIGRMGGKPGEGTERMRFRLYIEYMDWSYPSPMSMTVHLEGTVVKSEDEHGKTGEVAVEEVSWVSVPSNPAAVATGVSGSLQVGDGEPMKVVPKWSMDAIAATGLAEAAMACGISMKEATAAMTALAKPGAVVGVTKEMTTDAKRSKPPTGRRVVVPPGHRMIRFDDE